MVIVDGTDDFLVDGLVGWGLPWAIVVVLMARTSESLKSPQPPPLHPR